MLFHSNLNRNCNIVALQIFTKYVGTMFILVVAVGFDGTIGQPAQRQGRCITIIYDEEV